MGNCPPLTTLRESILQEKKEQSPEQETTSEKEDRKDTNVESGDNKEKGMEDDEAKKIVESITDSITSGEKRDIEESTKDIVKRAAQAVGSLKETEFDLRFNPDVFSPGVKHSTQESEGYQKQCNLIRDASDFLLTVQIPAFIRDCLDHNSVPMDGQTLSDNLHNRGINIRYIGVIANMLAKVPQLSYIHAITVSEIITRSAKHVFTSFLQGLDMTCLSLAISHFLNCFFTTSMQSISGGVALGYNSAKTKRNKRKSGRQASGCDMDWATLTSKSLWKLLGQEMLSYFNFDLNQDNIDDICSLFGLQRVSLLRSFCQKAGIQLQLREYFTSLSSGCSPFSEDDVINMFPRAKHINPRASDAFGFYSTGQSKVCCCRHLLCTAFC